MRQTSFSPGPSPRGGIGERADVAILSPTGRVETSNREWPTIDAWLEYVNRERQTTAEFRKKAEQERRGGDADRETADPFA